LVRTKPILRWPGGKTRHLKHILPLITPHRTYCEPFAGGLAVFLAKERSQIEVINDINGDLVALYRNVQYHVDAIVSEIEFALNARQNMVDYRAQRGLTEIQRAGRWFVCNKISWAGNGSSFGCQGAHASRRNAMDAVLALHERLDRTVIEQLPFDRCVKNYDRKDTFFFFDPPYLDANPGAYRGWSKEEMQHLREVLDGLKANWVLTVDDSKETRKIFAEFQLRQISTFNKIKNVRLAGASIMRELLITPAKARNRRPFSSKAGSPPAASCPGTSRSPKATVRTASGRSPGP
jgi:DNA adenine methylase